MENKSDTVQSITVMNASQANSHFESFSHRCAFLMIALENIAFEDDMPHNKQAAAGASYFIEDMLEEMSDIQTMLDAIIKTQSITSQR
ncbi:hypothetical protein [Oceanospirillum sediminis]|uniref:Uncharacterized protein n=1 Tax=Oceanospirillum sediminis TaxID=2760088 RepID=A0A839IQB0_9GAMM|nr:hypothetical protein [Oceanospirillum sediminis]MBB1487148.1 hypothetical protein [Oceanospirillum sediminis]